MSYSFIQYFSPKNRLVLYKILSDLIDEGVPIYDALVLINSKEGHKVYGSGFISKLDEIIQKMKSSASVAEVLTGLVPPQDLLIINAAEKTGQLSKGLRMIIRILEINKEIKSLVIQSLLPPTILFLVVLFVIMGYTQEVFPTFLNVLPIGEWPYVTRLLYDFGSYLVAGGLIHIILFVFLIIGLISVSMPILSGAFRTNVLDKLPPYNYYKDIQLGLFLRMLSSLLVTGVPMMEAIDLMKYKSTPWLSSHLHVFTQNMKLGKSYKDALDTGFMTNDILLTIKVYSGLDAFSDVVTKMADKSEEGVIQKINRLSTILKNVSLIVLACVVLWIFAAIFNLVDKLGSTL